MRAQRGKPCIFVFLDTLPRELINLSNIFQNKVLKAAYASNNFRSTDLI